MRVVNATWLLPPEPKLGVPCESCRTSPRAGVGVLEVPPGSRMFVVICPYCMVRAMADSLNEGVLIEIQP